MGKVYIEANRKEEATKINRWTDRKETKLSSQTDNIICRQKGLCFKIIEFYKLYNSPTVKVM